MFLNRGMNSPRKIKVAVYDTKPYDREHLGRAEGADRIEWQFHEFRLSEQTAALAEGAEAVCAFVNDEVNEAVLTRFAEGGVRLVALRCTGFNNVDGTAAKRLGVTVTRVPNYSPYAVAEHAVALILTLNRKTHRAYNRVRDLNFSLHGLVGFDLHGKTAGLVGTGRIGRQVGQILRGFGLRVLAHDPVPAKDWAAAQGVEYVEPRQLMAESDLISLHVPLTPETKHLINRTTLERMKPGAMLVNVSRGALIDTRALIAALKSGRLGGVGLDVYEEEEGVFFEDLSGEILQDDELARLLTFPNVLITAHQAFLTREALDDIARVTVGNLLRLADGQPYLEGTAL
jgi:D-lactate dehydrogenase